MIHGSVYEWCRDHWGGWCLIYARLRDKQKKKKTLHAFVSGKDVFVSLPTGHGKSLYSAALLPLVLR